MGQIGIAMDKEFMGHTPIANSKWGERTLGEALKQESIAWKIHEKYLVDVLSVETIDWLLNKCLMVVLSQEATLKDGRLAIKQFRQKCILLTKANSDEVEFCTCGDKRGMGRNDDGSCRDCGGA
jgi:hypothetical protein